LTPPVIHENLAPEFGNASLPPDGQEERMGQAGLGALGSSIAITVARRLAEAADSLENAESAEDFMDAVRNNQTALTDLRQAVPHLRGKVPSRLLKAALSLSAPRANPLDDHAVELLIGLDRLVSAALVGSFGNDRQWGR
jgi:hypothetical protein